MNKIPYGLYCYESIGENVLEDGILIHKTICCMYYRHDEGLFGKCSLLGEEVIDQCKICGYNDDMEEQ